MSKKQPMRKPQAKVNTAPIDPFADGYISLLDVPPPLKAYGEKHAIEFRWLNAKKIYDYNGYHPKGWKVFVLPQDLRLPSDELKFGRDPEGILRRGDAILGYKSKEDHARHRAALDHKAKMASGQDKYRAEEMRRTAREAKIDAVVLDGYEENN